LTFCKITAIKHPSDKEIKVGSNESQKGRGGIAWKYYIQCISWNYCKPLLNKTHCHG